MLELYHSINSVCAQKVRIALRGDQFDPAYLALNPNGVVPTPVHDGKPAAPFKNLAPDPWPTVQRPKHPYQRHRVRMYNKLIDDMSGGSGKVSSM
jgi:hypothetical protein